MCYELIETFYFHKKGNGIGQGIVLYMPFPYETYIPLLLWFQVSVVNTVDTVHEDMIVSMTYQYYLCHIEFND